MTRADDSTRKPGLNTLAVHAGRRVDPATGAVTMPIYPGTTYERDADGSYSRGFSYNRSGNPNRDALETCLAALESGAAAVAFASGMAAAHAVLTALAGSSGLRLLLPQDQYFGNRLLFQDLAQSGQVECMTVDMRDLSASRRAVRDFRPGLIWLETPSNPLVQVTDIAALAEIAGDAGALSLVDNTWATPWLQRPLSLGADLVLHSVTKYLGGHSDLMAGVLVSADAGLMEPVKHLQETAGAVPSPFDCWLALRGIQSLGARMRLHCSNAGQIAEALEKHPGVTRVHYPGLASDPGRVLAEKQQKLPGGMLSFEVAGGEKAALAVAARLQIITRATSLGGAHSLIEHRASIEGRGSSAPAGLLRLSTGLEDAEDLLCDLISALDSLGS